MAVVAMVAVCLINPPVVIDIFAVVPGMVVRIIRIVGTVTHCHMTGTAACEHSRGEQKCPKYQFFLRHNQLLHLIGRALRTASFHLLVGSLTGAVPVQSKEQPNGMDGLSGR